MTPLPRCRNLPVTLRGPLVMAGLLILLGFLASQSVLSALGRVQEARLSVGTPMSAMDEARGAPRPIAEADFPRGDPVLSRLIATCNHMTTAVESRAEADRRLAERERFVSLGRLSSSLAHEVNNPLGGLLDAADTILSFSDRPGVVRQSAGLMQRGLSHLRDVTRAILDQNRLDRTDQLLRPEDFKDHKLRYEPEVARRGANAAPDR